MAQLARDASDARDHALALGMIADVLANQGVVSCLP
jgi:hypothetical protein